MLTVVTQDRKYGMGERTILMKVAHGFSLFYVKTRKENNIYLIHQSIIGNVELRLIENGEKNVVILFDCCRLCVFVVIGNEHFNFSLRGSS